MALSCLVVLEHRGRRVVEAEASEGAVEVEARQAVGVRRQGAGLRRGQVLGAA